MTYNRIFRLRLTDLFITVFILLVTASCNKDNVIEDSSNRKPVIILDSEDGVYTVKIGQQLTISRMLNMLTMPFTHGLKRAK